MPVIASPQLAKASAHAGLISRKPAAARRGDAFKVNTGMRDQEVCSLQWSWEVKVEALGATVFVVPEEFVKNREDRLVVLNTEARAVVEQMRGRDPHYVFAYQRPRSRNPEAYSRPQAPRPIETMNNTAWQNASK